MVEFLIVNKADIYAVDNMNRYNISLFYNISNGQVATVIEVINIKLIKIRLTYY